MGAGALDGFGDLLCVIPDLIGDPWPNAQAMDPRFRGNDNDFCAWVYPPCHTALHPLDARPTYSPPIMEFSHGGYPHLFDH